MSYAQNYTCCVHYLEYILFLYRSILLGSRGFDVPKLSQRIETLNAAKTLEPIEPVWETDIEVYNKMMILNMTY